MADSSAKEVVDFRAKMKAQLKSEFQKNVWDPHRNAAGEGALFDPALQRFISMRACQYDYFKPAKKTYTRGLMLLTPFLVIGYFVVKDRNHKAHIYGTGQVAYKDRRYKFMN